MKRRDFLKTTGFFLTFPSLYSNSVKAELKAEKMLVLGFDGMDPRIVMSLIQRGQLPNIKKLMNKGTGSKMISIAPPESPAAWASFATGLDPAGHGVFGFLGRDPKNYLPFSTSAPITTPGKTIEVGEWVLPISSGDSQIFRKGKPFWEYLEEKEVESVVFKIPSNYPPSKMKKGRALSGMGTPDIYGANGVFTIYTDDEEEAMKDISGKANVYYAYFDEFNSYEGEINGPVNTLKKGEEETSVKFKAYWDKENKTARIDIQGKEILLAEGEMSEWIEIDFKLIPHLASVKAITQFFLLNAGENFRLYVYPPSISPADPAQAISSPAGYAQELARETGLFHTLGLPVDFNAIKAEIFDMGNFITQSDSILKESKTIFNYEFSRFLEQKRGMLFYYFSSIDQGSHILWALRDPKHPYYKPDETKRYGDQIEVLYRRFDEIVGGVVKKLPKDIPLIILSDHGFAPLRRKLNLNALLYQNGFLKFNGEPDFTNDYLVPTQANWSETKAYAMGLNGIYINLRGREGNGIVKSEDKRRVLNQISAILLALKDPATGENPVGKVFITEDHYQGDYLNSGPDIIVGCNLSYGLDYFCATGGVGKELLTDNLNRWTGDHIIDPHQVPAILMSNLKMDVRRAPIIWDLAPTILKIFGIRKPPIMRGKSLI